MIIPEKLLRAIGPHDITVAICETKLSGNHSVRAQYDVWKHHIDIDEDVPKQQRVELFWHEIVEALRADFDLDINHQTINVISNGIAQVIASLEDAYGKEIGC